MSRAQLTRDMMLLQDMITDVVTPLNDRIVHLESISKDLLEACKGAFAIMNEWPDDGTDRWCHNHDEVWRKLHAAIAKAEGK